MSDRVKGHIAPLATRGLIGQATLDKTDPDAEPSTAVVRPMTFGMGRATKL